MLAREKKDHVLRNTTPFTVDTDEDLTGGKQSHLLQVWKHLNTFSAPNELQELCFAYVPKGNGCEHTHSQENDPGLDSCALNYNCMENQSKRIFIASSKD